ncbi:MAG: hypothetical protein R2747_07150 [Pyrinomonadaceae bacterium]
MTWFKTKTARFIEEEMVAVQYLPSNYSRATPELVISLKGGAQMTFMGEEANELWERLGVKEEGE